MTDQSQIEETPPEAPPGALSGSPFAVAPRSDEPESGGEYDDSGILAGIGEKNDLSACLLALLEALDWQGEPQEVAEALQQVEHALIRTGVVWLVDLCGESRDSPGNEREQSDQRG